MKHLYFVRHGQSLVNVGGQFCTQVGTELDQGLTELGREQAVNDGKKAAAAGMQFDLILSSPLARARETARIIAKQVGYLVDSIEVLDLIKELDFGELEGTECELFYSNNTYADLGKFTGAETIEQLQQRAERALAHVSNLPQDNILLVSHSLFGRAIRRVVAGKPYTDEFTNGTSLPHGEILQLV
jgi:probable phosphoglycerate mutase